MRFNAAKLIKALTARLLYLPNGGALACHPKMLIIYCQAMMNSGSIGLGFIASAIKWHPVAVPVQNINAFLGPMNQDASSRRSATKGLPERSQVSGRSSYCSHDFSADHDNGDNLRSYTHAKVNGPECCACQIIAFIAIQVLLTNLPSIDMEVCIEHRSVIHLCLELRSKAQSLLMHALGT